MLKNNIIFLSLIFLILLNDSCGDIKNKTIFEQALHNGQLANEGYIRCKRFVEDWLKKLDDEQLTRELKKRGRMIDARYKARFAEYDFNNEMLLGDYYQERHIQIRYFQDIFPIQASVYLYSDHEQIW